MVRSMTGYGRGEKEGERVRVAVELKSINHRYCDITLRIPREIFSLEDKAKKVLQQYVFRGRVEAQVSLETGTGTLSRIRLDRDLARDYLEALKDLAGLGVKVDITASTLAGFPDIFAMEREEDPEDLWPQVEEALMTAGDKLAASRQEEGRNLALDLKERLGLIGGYVEGIAELAPGVVEGYRRRLGEQVEKLLPGLELPEERLLMEVVLFGEKSSISEELVRLKSHIRAFEETLNQEGAVGRKLDFILQEINREVNTISAKANDYNISRRVVEIKSQVEKIREQVQNIE